MRSTNDDDAVKFNSFLVRWNAASGSGSTRKGGFKRRKPVPQWQKDEARDAVEARRARMRY